MGRSLLRLGLILALALFAAGSARPAAAASAAASSNPGKIGVVLLHGKYSTNKPDSPIGRLGRALDEAGFTTTAPEMPWSYDRHFDATIETAFAEIDRAVAALKAEGVTKVVIAGHSLGANIGLAYATERPGLAGVIAIAPGHTPESPDWPRSFAGDVAKARAMVAAGKGDAVAAFGDHIRGGRKPFRLRAKIYLSYFDPDGLAAMSKTAARLPPGTPILWIVETNRLKLISARTTFERIPGAGRKQFIAVDASHNDAPARSAKQIIAWLKAL